MQGQRLLRHALWWAWAAAGGDGARPRGPKRAVAPAPHWGRNADVRANLPFLKTGAPGAAAGGLSKRPAGRRDHVDTGSVRPRPHVQRLEKRDADRPPKRTPGPPRKHTVKPALQKEALRAKMELRARQPAPKSDAACGCDCAGASVPSFVADGWCDEENNVAPCYDGGDCCQATCPPNAVFTCGIVGFTCADPNAGNCAAGYDCEAITAPPATYYDDNNDDGSTDDDGSMPDCSDGHSCPGSWIADGLCDGVSQMYGCDLSCYDDDGGDCCGGYTCSGGDDDDDDWDYAFSYSYEGACPVECYGMSCDDWTVWGNTCADLENTYGCDCAGCACEEYDFDDGITGGGCSDVNGYDCCDATVPSWAGDGWCDAENNESPCFDGGDCCEASCEDGSYDCGYNGYSCRDASTYDCAAASNTAGVGDGVCDAANNVEPCYDGGDCCEATCVSSECGNYECVDPAVLAQTCDEAMTCGACGSGCAWCAADLICAAASAPPALSSILPWATAATCDANDYVDTCPARDDPVPDPYYEAQWYLEAIRAPEAWAAGYTGSGVQILINDEGVDNTHPDLAKLDVANSCDVYAPSGSDAHGTVCASLAAGDSNSHCGAGAAPGAGLASCVLFSSSGGPVASQAWSEDYLAYNHNVNDISSNSWGMDNCWRTAYSSTDCPFACPSGNSYCPCDVCGSADWSGGDLSQTCEAAVVTYCAYYLEDDVTPCLELDHYFVQCGFGQLSTLAHDKLVEGTTEGRNGLGMVFVFAAGNEFDIGDDVNYEGYLNSRFTLSVGALGRDLKHSSYSSSGAPVFISAPGGDSENYHGMLAALPLSHGATDNCGDAGMGTSYAAPLVAGVVALVLEANPNLNWRDVQGVLAATASRPHEDEEDQWITNAAGVKHSYKYGFGLVDALAATAAATTWTTWGPELTLVTLTTSGQTLLDYDGAEHWVESTATAFTGAASDFVIEAVAVYVTIEHPRRGDLRIELERNGMTSLLTDDKLEFGKRYTHHKYTTLRHWGEAADAGAFTLRVTDRRKGSGDDDDIGQQNYYFGTDDGDENGVLVSWTLQLYGHDGDPAMQWTPQPTPLTAAEDRSYADGTACDESSPTCSDGSAAWCCDGDGSCTDGDDDYCCGNSYLCSNDSAEWAAANGGTLCCAAGSYGDDDTSVEARAWMPGAGWCSSDLDESPGPTSSAEACWDLCVDVYGAATIVAIDWTQNDQYCWCQNSCECMEDQGDDDIHLITSTHIAALPEACVGPCPDEENAYSTCLMENDSGRDDNDDDDDDGDDDFSPSTCDDVQQWLPHACMYNTNLLCQDPWFAYIECSYESLAEEALNLQCDFQCRTPSPMPTAKPTMEPTPAPFIEGSVSFAGLTEDDAVAHEDVIINAIADVAGVPPAAVTILSMSASARRRLADEVIVEYEIEAPNIAAIGDVEAALAKAEEDPTLVDAALESSARADTVESVAVFASVATTELHSEIVAPSPAPTVMPSTRAPTTAAHREKNERKEFYRNAGILAALIIAGVVCFCGAIGIGAFVGTRVGLALFKQKKTMRATTPAPAPPRPSAPPMPPVQAEVVQGKCVVAEPVYEQEEP